mgnify:CR=1 FL=1
MASSVELGKHVVSILLTTQPSYSIYAASSVLSRVGASGNVLISKKNIFSLIEVYNGSLKEDKMVSSRPEDKDDNSDKKESGPIKSSIPSSGSSNQNSSDKNANKDFNPKPQPEV